jgi:drug/metabolite transporter (DMT)-like permease
MNPVDIVLLTLLSAIWGSAFMFYRYLTPVLGPFITAGMRLLIAGAALCAFFLATRFRLRWRERWRQYLVIGLLNSAIPFVLFSFASLTLPSSVEVILNALSPMFGALFSALWLHESLTGRKIAGMVLGLAGVGLVSGFGSGATTGTTLLATAACIAATAFYGLAGVYIKKRTKDIEPKAIAAGSQLIVGLLLAPAIWLTPPTGTVTARIVILVLAFALLCSALAYLIYYRLVASVGPTKALMVTFLMPVFGFLWGALLLGERITAGMIGGTFTIVAGMYLIAGSRRHGGRDRG